jgi:hypothetical protein
MTKEKLNNILTQHVVSVKFKKIDGSERIMNCTLKRKLVPVYEKKTDRVNPTNDNLIVVWDLDKEAFRSFKVDSIIDYQVMQEN